MPDSKKIKLCSCNGSVPLGVGAISSALDSDGPLSVTRALCRLDHGNFMSALDEADDVIVGCTQEASLFRELASQSRYSGKLRFVNIREQAGWSAESQSAMPKVAALLAFAASPEPEPVPGLKYSSHGTTLIVGPMAAAVGWAEELKSDLDVSVLATSSASGELPPRREYPTYSGKDVEINGYLGCFNVIWEQSNPIDLERCTRCNACIRVCPERAIDFTYQIDLQKCRSHRACVTACGQIAAIDFDFAGASKPRAERFDLIFDLSPEPLIRLPHPPQGYFAPGRDPLAQAQAARMLVTKIGNFEKPKYFKYKSNICAHGRNEILGCNRCIDVCSTAAISHAGDYVEIDSHLCMGCGGCATVCPSGAMRYAYPSLPDMGMRLKALLGAYRKAGGKDACLLFHAEGASEELLMKLGRRGRGLPARVIPVPVYSVASVGLDLLLGAMTYGASQCVILSQADQPEGYLDATRFQMELGELILSAFGYRGRHLQLVVASDVASLDAAVWSLAPAEGVEAPAAFNLSDEKRTTLEFAFDHLAMHAPDKVDAIPLPAGAAHGSVNLDKGKCTLCMSCVGACPASALMDSPESPRLKFVERNCIQCGLCVQTCPEDALSLMPRLLLTPEVRQERVLHEAEPFNCVRCGKPFGTRQMIESMTSKLAGHSMFPGADALKRLQMCADCRVVDMMDNKQELTIFDL